MASLPENDLIFEVFTPAAKLSTPYLDCHYAGTKIKRSSNSGAVLFEDVEDKSPDLESLGRMYSVFRPVVSNENRRPRLYADTPVVDDDVARELVDLDSDQLFEQLCAVTNVVKPGPRPGLFVSHVNISDGVLRLWRDWLAEMADTSGGLAQSGEGNKILWVNAGQTIGVRMRVIHGPAERMPVLSGPDDHPPISYRLEYQGTSPWALWKETMTADTLTLYHTARNLCSHRKPALGSREVGDTGSFSFGQSHCDRIDVILTGHAYIDNMLNLTKDDSIELHRNEEYQTPQSLDPSQTI